MPVRVVRIIARLNVGGPARHATTLDAALRNHDMTTLLVHGSVDPAEGSLEDLVPSLGLRAHRIPELGRAVRPWSDLVAWWRLTALIFREQPDVVHTHTAKAGTLGRLAALAYNLTRPRARQAVVVHTFHGHVLSGYFGPAGDLAVRLVERTLARVTDRIVTISARQKHDICERFGVARPDQVDVIELGLDLDDLLVLGADGRLREALGLTDEAVVFTYAGRLVPIKDLPTLIRAFAVVATRVPQAHLVIAGDGGLRQPLEALAASLGLTNRVTFTGWRRDLDVLYAGTDVGVLSSINEGTPVALIEAMAAGRPVVATAVGGVEDIVAHERTGLVVSPGNVAALADAMERLALDPARRKRMGAAARAETGRRFSHVRLADDINRSYRRALEVRRGPLPKAGASE